MSTSAATNHFDEGKSPAATVARLYAELADELTRYCQGQLRSAQEAEDAVQTTFVHAVQALRRGVTPESESAWLYTIARNVCNDIRRADGRRLRLASDAELESVPARDAPDTDLAEELSDALATLPERQRRAFVLREWSGLSSSEVATRLGLRPSETYALLTRARTAMAAALAATTGRAALALHLGPLLLKLRALFAGGAAKTAAAATVVVAAAGGGLVVGQSADPGPQPGAFRSARAGEREVARTLVAAPPPREATGATGDARAKDTRAASVSNGRRPARRASAPGTSATTPVATPETDGEPPVGAASDETATATQQTAPPRRSSTPSEATKQAPRVERLVPEVVETVDRVTRGVRLPDLTVPDVPELLEPVESPLETVAQSGAEVVETVDQTVPALAEGQLPPLPSLPPPPPAPPGP